MQVWDHVQIPKVGSTFVSDGAWKLRLSDTVAWHVVVGSEKARRILYILSPDCQLQIVIVSDTVVHGCTQQQQQQQQQRQEKEASVFTKDVQRDERELRHGCLEAFAEDRDLGSDSSEVRLSGVQEAGGSVVPRCSSVLNRRWSGGRG